MTYLKYMYWCMMLTLSLQYKDGCAAVLACTRVCHIKKRNRKLVMHKTSAKASKQVEIRHFGNLAQKISKTIIISFPAFFVIFP